MSVRVYIIRHGETHENAKHIIQGQLDTQLNDAGIQQAGQCRDALKGVLFSVAYCSDLHRARDTARIILEGQADSEVPLHDVEALRERHMGELQGKQGNVHGKLPASVETRESVRSRLLKFWRGTLLPHVVRSVTDTTDSAEDSEGPIDASQPPVANVLFVSHGGTISALLLMLLHELDYSHEHGDQIESTRRIYNASISTVDVRPDGTGHIVRVADINHLLGPVVKKNADVVEDK